MSLVNVAVVALLAVAAPLLARSTRWTAAVPVIVLEILIGLAAGPHGLGWFSIDAPVDTLALLGVSFLFFLAGLEIDLRHLRGRLLARSSSAYVVGLGLAVGGAIGLHAAGLLEDPLLVAVAFSATGLGLVIPILRDAHLLRTSGGALVVAMASVAEFAAVVVLAVGFSAGGSPTTDVILLLALAALAVGVTVAGERIRRRSAVTKLVDRLSGGTVQLRVRLSVALVVGFAALADAGGLEVVLGAFFAGGILNVLDGDGMSTPALRDRLDGIGYGFLVPFFFVVSGARLDFSALELWPDALPLVPLLLILLLVARAAPALLLSRRDAATVGVGLLCATSLPVIVTAAQIGVASGQLGPSTAAAMTTAGLVGVCVFPPPAVALLRRSGSVEPGGQLGTGRDVELREDAVQVRPDRSG
jgi:Kef-type K+ transport system membrane component KefB